MFDARLQLCFKIRGWKLNRVEQPCRHIIAGLHYMLVCHSGVCCCALLSLCTSQQASHEEWHSLDHYKWNCQHVCGCVTSASPSHPPSHIHRIPSTTALIQEHVHQAMHGPHNKIQIALNANTACIAADRSGPSHACVELLQQRLSWNLRLEWTAHEYQKSLELNRLHFKIAMASALLHTSETNS